jgi:hypothetical protein
MALINTFIQRLTSFHRRCARYAAGQRIRQNAQTTQKKNGPYPPRRRMDLSTDHTVLEAAGQSTTNSGRHLRPTRRVVYSVSFPNDRCIPAMFDILSLACTGTNTRSAESCLVIVTSGCFLDRLWVNPCRGWYVRSFRPFRRLSLELTNRPSIILFGTGTTLELWW